MTKTNKTMTTTTHTSHLATITAYELKDGSFGYAYRNEETKEITRVGGFRTLSAATYAVKMLAWKTFGAIKYAKMNRKGEYLANVWS